jgi:hypothetical protein
MTDELAAELAARVGLGGVAAAYPALVRASIERGTTGSPTLDAARQPTTEPAHVLAVALPPA